MMAFLAYYLFVFPVSLLPLRVLYGFSTLIYWLAKRVFPYRNFVITRNLMRSFPELNQDEIKELRNEFYRHFSDILVEGIKNLSISKKELKKRMKFLNPALIQNISKTNQSIILVGSHYNNWEWMITAQACYFEKNNFGIGMPMTSKFWDKKINQRRMRFGLEVINAKNFKEKLIDCTSRNESFTVLTLSDQSPGDGKKSYWTKFLNQDTAVLFGAELMANDFNAAVVYFKTRRVKRGYYEVTFEQITTAPKLLNWGEITEAHVKLLSSQIEENRSNWLWSHKRWKREKPDDLNAIKEEQKNKFNQKYKI